MTLGAVRRASVAGSSSTIRAGLDQASQSLPPASRPSCAEWAFGVRAKTGDVSSLASPVSVQQAHKRGLNELIPRLSPPPISHTVRAPIRIASNTRGPYSCETFDSGSPGTGPEAPTRPFASSGTEPSSPPLPEMWGGW